MNDPSFLIQANMFSIIREKSSVYFQEKDYLQEVKWNAPGNTFRFTMRLWAVSTHSLPSTMNLWSCTFLCKHSHTRLNEVWNSRTKQLKQPRRAIKSGVFRVQIILNPIPIKIHMPAHKRTGQVYVIIRIES